MNKNNLSWVDNKVFNTPSLTQSPQMRPMTELMPSQFNVPGTSAPSGQSAAMPSQATPEQGGVSPATYTDTKPSASAGFSPAEETTGRIPGQTGMPGAQSMTPSAMQVPAGVSPEQYQAPIVSPVQTGLAPSDGFDSGAAAQGVLTRNESFGVGPIPFSLQGPPTVLDPGYVPAYLRTQIGKRVRAEFNIGTNMYMDRSGILREVGISYFVLEDNITRVRVMCDLYSLKFLSSEP